MNQNQSFTFILMGKTGAGKSSVLNSLVGEKRFPEGDGLRSKTKEVVEYKGKLQYDNSVFSIIDTPGFYDTDKEDNKHINNLVKFFKSLKEFGGLNCVFYVLSLHEQRFDSSLQTSLHLLQTILGDDLFKMIKIIFTFKNQLIESAYIKSLDRFQELPQFLISSGFPVNETLETFIYDYDRPQNFCKDIIRSVKNSPKFYPEVLDHMQNIDFDLNDPMKVYASLISSSKSIHNLHVKMCELENIIKTYELQCVKFEEERKQYQEQIKNYQIEMEELRMILNDGTVQNKKEIKELIQSYEEKIHQFHQEHLKELNKIKMENEKVNKEINEEHIKLMEKQHKSFTEIMEKMRQDNQNQFQGLINLVKQNSSTPQIITQVPNSRNRPSGLEYIAPITNSLLQVTSAMKTTGCSIF
jgi:hypothetical protein